MKQIDIKAFKRKTAGKRKIYTTFLKNFHRRKITGVDSLAAKMTKETFREIDCRNCANCCKTMTPTYSATDIKRISAHVNLTPAEYKEKYLYQDDEGDWMHFNLPCHFLGKDNLCTIYEIRPTDCRGYPHAHKKEFNRLTDVHIQNLSYCPATFRVVEKMFEKIVEKKA